MAMLKQQLSFQVFSKTLNKTLCFLFPASPFTFLVFSAPVLHRLAHFQPRDNRGKHNFEKKYFAGIILMTYVNVLTRARTY